MRTHKPITKPGQHGTLYRYRIEYRDSDPGYPPGSSWDCWAYSAEHALEQFSERGDGFVAVRWSRLVGELDGGRWRLRASQTWHELE